MPCLISVEVARRSVRRSRQFLVVVDSECTRITAASVGAMQHGSHARDSWNFRGNFAPLSQSRANDSKCGGKRLMREQCETRVTGAPPFRHTVCNERLTIWPRRNGVCGRLQIRQGAPI
jgi:hypothetical protein